MKTPKQQLQEALDDKFKREHPNVPSYAYPKPKKVKNNATSLQNDIEKFCKLNGQLCEQVQTKGTFRKGIGYTAGNYTKGSADIHIVMWSSIGELKVWFCEVKVGNDIQSEDQKKYEDAINNFMDRWISGRGFVKYSIVKSFDDFHEQYLKLFNQ